MPEQPEVRLTIQRAEVGAGQMAAWVRLWARLLEALTTRAAVDKPEEDKAIVRRLNERVGCQENENG